MEATTVDSKTVYRFTWDGYKVLVKLDGAAYHTNEKRMTDAQIRQLVDYAQSRDVDQVHNEVNVEGDVWWRVLPQ